MRKVTGLWLGLGLALPYVTPRNVSNKILQWLSLVSGFIRRFVF